MPQRLGERGGGRGPGGVRQAIDALIRLGLVSRNPSHGHPLRSEFVLLPEGIRVAMAARAVVQGIEQWAIQDIAFRKWSLPVLARRVVHGGRPVTVGYEPTARAGEPRPHLGRLAAGF
jgi:hypothetical protein